MGARVCLVTPSSLGRQPPLPFTTSLTTHPVVRRDKQLASAPVVTNYDRTVRWAVSRPTAREEETSASHPCHLEQEGVAAAAAEGAVGKNPSLIRTMLNQSSLSIAGSHGGTSLSSANEYSGILM